MELPPQNFLLYKNEQTKINSFFNSIANTTDKRFYRFKENAGKFEKFLNNDQKSLILELLEEVFRKTNVFFSLVQAKETSAEETQNHLNDIKSYLKNLKNAFEFESNVLKTIYSKNKIFLAKRKLLLPRSF